MNGNGSPLKILTLACEEAAFLASEELDRPLTASETVAVRVHHVICPGCRRYRRQVRFLRDALHRLENAECGAGGGPTLPPEAREEILRSLGDDGPGA